VTTFSYTPADTGLAMQDYIGGPTFPKIVQHGGGINNGSGGVAVVLGSTPTVGNLMLAFISWANTSPTMPTGWTRLYDQSSGGSGVDQHTVAYRMVQSGDGTSYTFTSTEANQGGIIYELSGVDPATPIFQSKPGSSGNATVALSGTSRVPSCLLVAAATGDNGTTATISPSTNWTRDEVRLPSFHPIISFTRSTQTTKDEAVSESITVTGDGFFSSGSLVFVQGRGTVTRIPAMSADTGLTVSDSIVRTALRARTASDTGLTSSSSLARTAVRLLTSTGLTLTSTLARVRYVTALDQGLRFTERLDPDPLLVVPGLETGAAFGKITVGVTAYPLDADTSVAARFSCPEACRLEQLVVYLDGLGSGGGGSQVARGVVYEPDGGALVGVGDEFTILAARPAGWYPVPFLEANPGGLPLEEGDYELGLIGGGSTDVIRLYGDLRALGSGRSHDTYADGPALTSPAWLAAGHDLSIFSRTFLPFAADVELTALEVARLPFQEAQAGLRQPGRVGPPIFTTLGWHGQGTDATAGSYALVSPDGPLAGTAGSVLRVSPLDGADPVYAYVLSDQADVDDPLTVTRNLFLRIALAATYDLPVLVEVVPS
jgi:hypothetical protein